MKLVTFDAGRGPRLGALTETGALDLAVAATRQKQTLPISMQAFIELGPKAWDLARELIKTHHRDDVFPSENIQLLAPIPHPVRFRDACLFLEHMEKALGKLDRPFDPEFKRQVIYYNADNVHVSGTGAEIVWPRDSSWIDYELEWACVVGTPGVDIALENASDHIFGFTILNDWSARDLQFPFMGCGLGPAAGKDFANSFGPCIVTPDEFDDPYSLQMSARINGEQWSNGTTSSMYWRFEDAISQLSKGRPLIAGEIFGSGTVLDGCGFELERQLSFGDVVELQVEGLGILKNRIAHP